jgi:hypothetical protein
VADGTPRTPAEHRAEALELLTYRVIPDAHVSEHSTTTDVLASILDAVEAQVCATHALVHAVLALGKTPDAPFSIVDRDDEG